MRKSLSKKIREQVWLKYDKHCAYCGCELPKLADMQADHINSVYVSEVRGNEIDNSIANLMPACKQCNLYKSTMTIEDFRDRLKTTMFKNLQKTFNYRLALKYGLIIESNKPIKFYFEQFEPSVQE